MPVIIGLTSPNCAGKGEVARWLVEEYGFLHLSVRELLEEKLGERGRVNDRNAMRLLANELRAQHGHDYFVRVLCERACAQPRPVVVESIRNPSEVRALRHCGARLFAVNADLRVRYERASKRGSSTDRVSFQEFCTQDDAEMFSVNPHEQSVGGCVRSADVLFTNNGTVEELQAQIDAVMQCRY